MAFQLISDLIHQEIKDLVDHIPSLKIPETSTQLAAIIDQIRNDIPEKRRISTGRYSIAKALGEALFPLLEDPFAFGVELYQNLGDPFVRSTALQLLSLWAAENAGLDKVKAYFEAAAGEEDWIVRECASGLVRKLTKAFPKEVRAWYLALVKSPDPNLRRFVSESLRPVVENRWFHKDPDYALGVIRHLFQESAPYPRTSVGNNLSDWMRVDPLAAWPIVEELAASGDKNSYWIAYRACRNYVKQEPALVMETLGVREYKYKNRRYYL
jgi:3-methyladenine DNA glycosylase AlkC